MLVVGMVVHWVVVLVVLMVATKVVKMELE